MANILEDMGNVIGFILSFIYTIISCILGYIAYKTKQENKDVNIEIYITIFILMLLVIIDLGYYLANKNDPNKKKVNETVASIALTPIIAAGVRHGGPILLMLFLKR